MALLFAAALPATLAAAAFRPDLNFARVGTEAGLPGDVVTAVHRDRQGFLLMAAGAPGLAEPVIVRILEPTFQRATWDPAAPPPRAPKTGDRDAFTDLRYRCSTRLDVHETARRDDGQHILLDIRVDGVVMDLKLEVTEYLPPSPTERLEAHEHGHRLIAEAIHADAGALARELAQAWLGKTLVARGTDARVAVTQSVQRASRELGKSWIDAVLARANAAQLEYDALTDHGLNTEPTSQEATRLVLVSDD